VWKVKRCHWLQLTNEEELRVSAVLFCRKQQQKLSLKVNSAHLCFKDTEKKKLTNCKTITQYMIISFIPSDNAFTRL
jgi:hypothetical protein